MEIHVSLRELIAIVAFFALGIGTLRAGGLLASLTVFIGSVLVMAIAIIAFVGAAQPKAFAIGFLLPVLIYASIVLVAGSNELDPYAGQLPTTRVLRYAHEALVTTTWVDPYSGVIVSDYDPTKYTVDGINGGGLSGGQPVRLNEHPDRPTFMSLAHIILGMMFGWFGGKFAVYIHRSQHTNKSG